MRRLASTPHLYFLLHVLLLVSGAAAGVLRAAITLSLPTATTTTTPPPNPTLAPHLQMAVAAAAAATTSTPQAQFTTNSRILACWATMEELGGSAGGLMHATPTAAAALAPHLATQPAGSHCTTRLPQSVMSEYADFTKACWRWMSTISTSWASFATQCPEFVGTRPFIRGDWDVTVQGFCPTTATVFWTAPAAPTILEAVATPTGLGHLIGARAPTPTPVRAMVNSTVLVTAGAARAGSSSSRSRGLGLLVAGVAIGSIKLLSIL
ncbi:hypothetical protein RB595_007940 [Gaeumannomyces hyphopodioides]